MVVPTKFGKGAGAATEANDDRKASDICGTASAAAAATNDVVSNPNDCCVTLSVRDAISSYDTAFAAAWQLYDSIP